MKLYLVSQETNCGYDVYNSIVVCAENEEKAKRIHPLDKRNDISGSWVTNVKDLQVEYIGEAREGMEEGEICAS